MSEATGIGVRVEDLHKTYEKGGVKIRVLAGVELAVQAGERIAILGPSGSGKSTFLHILGTLDHPTSGKVFFDEESVFDRPRKGLDQLRNQRVGFVFQFHHLLPDETALGNVAMPLMIRGMETAVARQTAANLLERVGLAPRENHLPGELSGGEQQRVAIARALVSRPGLLLADEPTGNLDPRTADGVLELFLELNAAMGATMVVVTHSRDLAARFPRRLTVVDGRLEES